MNPFRRQILLGSFAAGCGTLTKLSLAQDAWPNKPIRVISPGAAGGGSDIFVRLVEPRLRERLGQGLFIENHPGAGGMTGAAVANTARPDGYTFFVSNVATNGIGVSLYRKPTFDPKKDLPPVARIATLSNALAVRSDKGINSVAELVAFLRVNPKQAFFGSAGSGTTSHLSALLFGQRIGVELTHVPYKGTAANLSALLGGETLFSMDNLPLYATHAKAGTLKLLAVTRSSRAVSHPDVPTLQESGIKDFDISSWYGLSAATGTPQAIINRMGLEIVSALSDPAIAARIRDIGAEPAGLDPQAYAAFINAEIQKWAPLVKVSNAMVD
jgi:tripartite-type tricarboxylate transporter receptor subunit TctC